MTQHEHGPLRDDDDPTGFTAAVAFLLFAGALVILGVLLAVCA